jgi:hypothetical protein
MSCTARFPNANNNLWLGPRPTVFVDADYNATGREEAIIVLAGDDGDVDEITVTFANNTQAGISTRIVAAGRPVSVDGDDNNVFPPTTVALGTARVFTFAGPPASDTECGDPGVWVPDAGGTGA